jgi:hypothetical protein
MTPSEIETAARRMLNAAGSSFWSSDEIIGDYLYMAAMEMASETFCIENRYSTTSVSSQEEYAKPTRSLAIKRVTYDGEKLKPISAQQRDSIDLNTNTTITGTPQYYDWFDESIILFPAPDSSSKTIKIWSYDEPSRPTSTSTLEIPTRFHGYLVIGTAYYMSLKELGHPHVSRFEVQWAMSIDKVRKSVRLRNKDNFHTVLHEEDQPSTNLGMI